MRLDSIDPNLILGIVNEYDYESEDENKGLFGKLFRKKKVDKVALFINDIEVIGIDILEKEILNDDYILAYTIDKDRTDLYVVLTENYLIIPNQVVVSLSDVKKYGLFNVLNPDFAQYAEDRLNIPYDPTFRSEYEGEDTYELDRFSMAFAYVDKFGLSYEYTFYMDVADRKEFYEYLSARLEDKADWTSRFVISGRFEDDSYIRPF